ncbi:hypothetical protein ABEB36_004859 [Hypothenemus hampei]|uniref:Uncharacterized protein n=1 Tax=Hypothenemus hampei TaxID=57062 RepID=A0ABD1EW34_HYPHA
MQGKKPIKKQSQQEKNFLTPQGHGDGHEIRAQSLLAKKRPPVSSARKFNARIPKDETLVHKLEESLKETHCQDAETTISRKTSHDQKLKAASVAEITPTKSNKRSCNVSLETGYEVYATPRLHIPVKIYCRQEKYICIVYKRLVLLAWRRSRAYISSMQEQLEKQRQQIAQLGLQTNTLGILRTSESQKRMQNHAEYQQLKRTVELFELENGRLNEVLENMQSQMETLQNNLKIAKTENSVLSDEANEMRDIICKKNSEEKILEERIKRQEEIVSAQNVYLGDLKDKMMELDSELKKCKVNCYVKERKYAKLKCNQWSISISKHDQLSRNYDFWK